MIIPRPPAVRGKAEEVQAVLTDGLLQGVDLLQLLMVGALLQASLQQLCLLALQVVLLLHLLIPGGVTCYTQVTVQHRLGSYSIFNSNGDAEKHLQLLIPWGSHITGGFSTGHFFYRIFCFTYTCS